MAYRFMTRLHQAAGRLAFWRRGARSDSLRGLVPDDPSLLLLRSLTGYGDHLMLSAVIEGVRVVYPERRMVLAVNYPEIFEHNPHVAAVVRKEEVRKRWPAWEGRFTRVGFRQPEERYLQVSGHLIDDMYGCLGLPLKERPRQPRIYLTEAEERLYERKLAGLPRPRVAVVPHGKSSVRLPNKIYPPEQWEELGRRLVASLPTVIQVGSRRDGALLSGARDFLDIGYRQTASLLRQCDLLVTHVGGLMHLAAAVRTPAVVLYGAAEHPEISGYPWNRNLYVPIECGPCWLETPCSHHSCMRQLTPERVVAEVEAALRELPGVDAGRAPDPRPRLAPV